ncbi:unnamed protein product [Plutella xylostella]|uniref:(diamondback moth) hypothetical protein n=1 Tax=Plutella xylostella TaxID=51655 RepID=A0A8S4ED99_PLUXY|nr:unnamed protein product [Plutella xylostella]
MNICRACLSGTCDLVGIDPVCLDNYNLLTDLAARLDDSLPHSLCRPCCDTVDYFIEFRKKCIESEASLNACIIKNVKYEEKVAAKTESDKVKVDSSLPDAKVKLEIDCNEPDDETYFNDDGFDAGYMHEDDYVALVVKSEVSETKDEKEVRPKRKYTKRKSNTAPKAKTKREKKVKPKKEVSAPKKTPTKEKKEKQIEVTEPMPCGLCKSSFDTQEALRSHVEKHKEDTTCRLCGERFKAWPAMISHRVNHATDPTQSRCHVCWKAYRTEANLHFHYLTVHYDKEFTGMECNCCGKIYKDGNKMNKHLRTTHGMKRFICDHCGKVFHLKQSLAVHMNTHATTRRHRCDLCDYATIQPSALAVCIAKYNVTSRYQTVRRTYPHTEATRAPASRGGAPHRRLRRIQGARGDPHINNREPAVRPPFVTSCSDE